MKNVILATALFGTFAIALFLSDAPSRNEFTSDMQATLSKLAEDLPRPSSDRRPTSNSRPPRPVAVIAQTNFRCGQAAAQRLTVEPDCGGWDD